MAEFALTGTKTAEEVSDTIENALVGGKLTVQYEDGSIKTAINTTYETIADAVDATPTVGTNQARLWFSNKPFGDESKTIDDDCIVSTRDIEKCIDDVYKLDITLLEYVVLTDSSYITISDDHYTAIEDVFSVDTGDADQNKPTVYYNYQGNDDLDSPATLKDIQDINDSEPAFNVDDRFVQISTTANIAEGSYDIGMTTIPSAYRPYFLPGAEVYLANNVDEKYYISGVLSTFNQITINKPLAREIKEATQLIVRTPLMSIPANQGITGNMYDVIFANMCINLRDASDIRLFGTLGADTPQGSSVFLVGTADVANIDIGDTLAITSDAENMFVVAYEVESVSTGGVVTTTRESGEAFYTGNPFVVVKGEARNTEEVSLFSAVNLGEVKTITGGLEDAIDEVSEELNNKIDLVDETLTESKLNKNGGEVTAPLIMRTEDEVVTSCTGVPVVDYDGYSIDNFENGVAVPYLINDWDTISVSGETVKGYPLTWGGSYEIYPMSTASSGASATLAMYSDVDCTVLLTSAEATELSVYLKALASQPLTATLVANINPEDITDNDLINLSIAKGLAGADIATINTVGVVKPDGASINVSEDGTITATASAAVSKVVSSAAEMLALPQIDNLYIVTRTDEDQLFYLNDGLDPVVLSNWIPSVSTGNLVSSFTGTQGTQRTGAVEAMTGDYTLEQVQTADITTAIEYKLEIDDGVLYMVEV